MRYLVATLGLGARGTSAAFARGGPLNWRLSAITCMAFLGAVLLCGCASESSPITATVYPNLAQAREQGFQDLVGHPPFTADFRVEAEGGEGELSYAWDFDDDGQTDSDRPDPEPFTYLEPGEYTATLNLEGDGSQTTTVEQRIVVVGDPEWPDWRYGMADHLDRGNDLYANDAERERAARLISEAGVEAVRVDLAWAGIQPNGRDEYEWKDYDDLIGLTRRYGLDVLPVIDYSSGWASTAPNTWDASERVFAPPVPTEYAWFAYKAVDRYKADIRAWEVWNEPNHRGFWRPEPDPARYAELLRQAYLAIKYADPEAVVVSGGLANGGDYVAPEPFLQAVYDAGGGPYLDVVGSHPYTYPSSGTASLVGQLDALRDVMTANGDGWKPIWATEYGASAVPAAGVSDETQAAWFTQSLDTIFSADNVPVVFWYNFKEKGTDPNVYGDNYGLVEEDWSVKPAYEAYKSYTANDP